MGILDEAIREHLELKRQHGADDSELKQLEHEAFGPAERPDAAGVPPEPPSEAPTEFMAQPEAPPIRAEDAAPEPLSEAPARREPSPEIASLQEPPEQDRPPEAEPGPEQEPALEQEAEPPAEAEREAEPAPEPAQERQSPMEHEAISEPPGPAGPTTEERRAISEHPTEHYDVERELEEAGEAPAEEPPPSAEEAEEDDEFFDEQRLSDELDQALETPEEDELEEERGEHEDEGEEGEEDEAEYDEEHPGRSEEDVLDETPDFLEDSDDDQLWFEQKPPKDFDFDD